MLTDCSASIRDEQHADKKGVNLHGPPSAPNPKTQSYRDDKHTNGLDHSRGKHNRHYYQVSASTVVPHHGQGASSYAQPLIPHQSIKKYDGGLNYYRTRSSTPKCLGEDLGTKDVSFMSAGRHALVGEHLAHNNNRQYMLPLAQQPRQEVSAMRKAETRTFQNSPLDSRARLQMSSYCFPCTHCIAREATLYCGDCREAYCVVCFPRVRHHRATGLRLDHQQQPLGLTLGSRPGGRAGPRRRRRRDLRPHREGGEEQV